MTSAKVCLVVALAMLPMSAIAQEELTRNDFNIDAVTGPVLGSGRIVGMGGAYTALADGINGAAWNPASFGSRYLFEVDWFEWDLGLSLFSPGVFGQTNFYNSDAESSAESFIFLGLGLRFQLGQFGFGVDLRTQLYQIAAPTGEGVNVTVLEAHTGLAYAFLDGQLVIGVGARVADLDLALQDAPEDQTDLVHFTGAGAEVGVLLRLADQPWRLGVAGRLPVESEIDTASGVETSDEGVRSVRGFVLPEQVYMPWEVQVGIAWQFGGRPLNQVWEPPPDPEDEMVKHMDQCWCRRKLKQLRKERAASGNPLPAGVLCPDLPAEPADQAWWEREHERQRCDEEALDTAIDEAEDRVYWQRLLAYQDLPRDYWLVSAELLIVGPTQDGVGVDGFLDKKRFRSGEEVSVGFRLGAETELFADILKVRAGFYLEPPRGVGADHRPHGTVGFDVRLFRWDFFGAFDPFEIQAGFTGDFAPGYIDLGIGVGFWH